MSNSSSNSAPKSGLYFWQGLSVLALLACVYTALMHGGTPARADNGGATARGIIAMMGVNSAKEHLYMIDTTNQVVLMYENIPGNGLHFVSGRSYAGDEAFVNKVGGGDVPYKPNGYTVKDVATALNVLPRPANGNP